MARGACREPPLHFRVPKVVKAFDYKEQRTVAIKIVRNKARFHAQASRAATHMWFIGRRGAMPRQGDDATPR